MELPSYQEFLIKEQMDRFEKFCAAHPEMGRLESRRAFFGQRYEINISYTIVQEIDAQMPNAKIRPNI